MAVNRRVVGSAFLVNIRIPLALAVRDPTSSHHSRLYIHVEYSPSESGADLI